MKKIFAILLSLGFCSSAIANTGVFPRTFIIANQNIYTGSNNISFSEAGNGYGASLLVLTQHKFLVPYFSVGFNYMKSKQSFYDTGTNTVSSSFNYYNGEGAIGARLYPLLREKSGFNPFLSGGGLLGYNVIQLNQSTTLTTIPHSDQSFSAGYAAGIGTEWIVSKNGSYHTSFLLQFEYKYSTATLLNKTFTLSHGTLSFGFGW